jgi:hypothetical protein
MENANAPAIRNADHQHLAWEVTIEEEGYAYIYISNENPTLVDMFFDDVTMTYTPTRIIQYNENYPFGLQNANSWTRSGNSNEFLYNAASEKNTSTGWYEMFFRDYDAAIGRCCRWIRWPANMVL